MLLKDITDDLLGKLRIDISCTMCDKLVNVKVSTARCYIKRNGYDYVCHGCKVKLNSDWKSLMFIYDAYVFYDI